MATQPYASPELRGLTFRFTRERSESGASAR